jgi:hypothetical protein
MKPNFFHAGHNWFCFLLLSISAIGVTGEAQLNFSATGFPLTTNFEGPNRHLSVLGWNGVVTEAFDTNATRGTLTTLQELRSTHNSFPLTGWDSAYPETSWKSSDWLGGYEPSTSPWVYHATLGWLFCSQKAMDSLWLWHSELGWVWTNSNRFPYLFQNSAKAWLLYEKGSHLPVRLFDYANGKWFEIGHRKHNIETSSSPTAGGTVDGGGLIKDGKKAFLLAKPATGYLFSGWEGDASGSRNPLTLANVKKNHLIVARFEPLSQGIESLASVVSATTHLTTREKKVALLQLAYKGTSPLLSVGSSEQTLPMGSKAYQLAKAMGLQTSDMNQGDFGLGSATINHSYMSWITGDTTEADFEGVANGNLEIHVKGAEIVDGVDSLVVEFTQPDSVAYSRWFAKDNSGSVWLLKEKRGEIMEVSYIPFLPAKPKAGWKNWNNASAVPKTNVIIANENATVRLRDGSLIEDCIELHFRSPTANQIEYYAKEKNLVKIEKL